MSRHRLIVKRVYKGLEVDDDAETVGKERIRRRWKFVDGWIDDETTILTGIPVARNVAKDFYIGERDDPDVMDRAWAEGTERTGLTVVANDLGGREVATFTWSGDLTHDEEEELEWEADADYLFVKVIVRTRNGSDSVVRIWEYDENDDFVPGDGPDDCVIEITSSPPREETDLILREIPEGHALTIEVVDGGGSKNVVIKLILRERTG